MFASRDLLISVEQKSNHKCMPRRSERAYLVLMDLAASFDFNVMHIWLCSYVCKHVFLLLIIPGLPFLSVSLYLAGDGDGGGGGGV